MPIANAYKEAVQNIINRLNSELTPTKPRRHLSTLFLDLPDPSMYPDYYSIITEPRSIGGVQEKLQKNRYRNILDVLNDLHLVFANAIHYNEASSQISKDAAILQELFRKLWKDDPYLPNAEPTKQPGRKPGFRAAPLPRMSSFAPPIRHNPNFQSSYSTAVATVQLKPLGKPPAPIVAPRLQPLKKKKRKRAPPVAPAAAETMVVEMKSEEPAQRARRPGSPAFSEVDFNTGVEGEEDDPEIPQTHIANEIETPAIVARLEQSMPLWEPWSNPTVAELGWMPELQGEALHTRLQAVVLRVRNYTGADSLRSSIALEQVKAPPDPYSVYKVPMNWEAITTKAHSRQYASCRQFEIDLFRMFEKARRAWPAGGSTYGWILICQRIANLTTSAFVTDATEAPLTVSSAPGPRRAQPSRVLVNGVPTDNPQGSTSYIVLDKGRNPIQSIIYKGIEYKIGEFVHLFNEEDIARPLIGQIWACWTKDGRDSFTVCWYLRPEQTIHGQDHPFYENEVVKTGLYVDYVAEDIIEKVAVQFHPHYFTGRPRPPHWYPGRPLYMCEQRYDERNHSFHHITNPENCFPPSLRPSTSEALSNQGGNSVMHAPLFRNAKLDIIQPIYCFERLVFPVRKTGPNAGPRLPAASMPTSYNIGPGDTKEAVTAVVSGGYDARGRPKRMAAVKAANAVGTVVPSSPGPGGSSGASAGLAGDRTIVTAAGGGMITSASVDRLPPETTQLFDRDPLTNEMLWFSGPPVDVAKPPKLRYSLDYLYQLALNQKGAEASDAAPSTKRSKTIVPPSASEVWYEVSKAESAIA